MLNGLLVTYPAGQLMISVLLCMLCRAQAQKLAHQHQIELRYVLARSFSFRML